MSQPFTIAKFVFAICFPFALFGVENFLPLPEIEKFSAEFSSELRKVSTPEMIYDGAVCAVEKGETVFMSKSFHDDANAIKAIPLGRSSLALISLLALEMCERGKLPSGALSTWTETSAEKRPQKNFLASSICSLYADKGGNVLLSDFFDMRAKIPPRADSLIPNDASPEDLFAIVSSFDEYPVPESFSRGDFSAASVSLGAYILAYCIEKKTINLKENFRKIADEFLCLPLGFSHRRFVALRSRDKISPVLEPAYSFALPIEDIAKWLECETSPRPKISNNFSIAKRREGKGALSFSAEKSEALVRTFSAGWLCAEEEGVKFFVSGDSFRGHANIVAIFPRCNSALAIVVYAKGKISTSQDADAIVSKLCAKAFSDFLKTLKKCGQLR